MTVGYSTIRSAGDGTGCSPGSLLGISRIKDLLDNTNLSPFRFMYVSAGHLVSISPPLDLLRHGLLFLMLRWMVEEWQQRILEVKEVRLELNQLRKKQMSEKFDGMYLYEYMGDSLPKYEIRGNYIHEYKKTWQPVYEIRGSCIHDHMQPSKIVYEIRGKHIYKYMQDGQPIYEIRNR